VLQTIWKGMPVVDSAGALIGAVKDVRQGDLLASLVADEPPVAEQLHRSGFLTVEGAGLTNHGWYVAADQIAYADEDVVRLAARADQLAEEHQLGL
jgi:hypothetical protein